MGKVEDIKKEQIQLLEQIAGFSKNQARDMVLKKVEDMMSLEIASMIKDRETEAKLEADKKSKAIIFLLFVSLIFEAAELYLM